LLLLVTGAALGVAADRLWVAPAQAADGRALTPDAMSARLGLSDAEAARLSTLLDSLHTTVTAAAAEGPTALRAATDAAHRRIEASLRPESRPAFHSWMQESRDHMMQRMRPGAMHPGMMHPGAPTRGDSGALRSPPRGSR
jgi:hypothetical protein